MAPPCAAHIAVDEAGKDLTASQEAKILLVDNGPWDGELLHHYCLRGRCELGCQDNPRVSQRLVRNLVLLSVDGSTCIPLLYRWKGFEECNAKNLRARLQHKLLDGALGRLYPAAFLERAAREVGSSD